MEKSNVRVGQKYHMKRGGVVCEVSVVENIGQGFYTCSYKSGKVFKKHKSEISKWERVVVVKQTHKKRIEQPTLVQSCVAALKAEGRFLTPTQIVKVLAERSLYQFTEKAKTPHCTVSSRLNAYIKNGGNDIQKNGRGHFAAEGVTA